MCVCWMIEGKLKIDENVEWMCSVIGAIIIAMGFYTVLWGQAKEKKADVAADDDDNNTTSAIQNTTTAPLLQNYNNHEQA